MPVSAATVAWLQFVICAAVIGVAGTFLSRHGGGAGKTGVGGTWIGSCRWRA